MDDIVGVEVYKSQDHVVSKVGLDVEGYGPGGDFYEVCEALVHQLHEQYHSIGVRVAEGAKILDNVGVVDPREELALLLEPVGRGAVAPGPTLTATVMAVARGGLVLLVDVQ